VENPSRALKRRFESVWLQLLNGEHNGSGKVQATPQNQGEKSLVRRQANVAVIGAGAAGLVAAKELRAEGHIVSVFEQVRVGLPS
jgi:NADPH-dependent 2,4-dienoyl-CoA reductase/sulfur reductase-like enzyme